MPRFVPIDRLPTTRRSANEPRLPAYYRGRPIAEWRHALAPRRREGVRYRPAHGAKPRDLR